MLTCVSSRTRSHHVAEISGQAEKKITGQLSINERIIEAKKTILAACEKDGVSVEALKCFLFLSVLRLV
jgi:hypothetical protein